jgi:hypothetical protein
LAINQKASLRELFEIIDADASGLLDEEEVLALATRLGRPLSHSELDAAMKEMDVDESGGITFDEFEAWCVTRARGCIQCARGQLSAPLQQVYCAAVQLRSSCSSTPLTDAPPGGRRVRRGAGPPRSPRRSRRRRRNGGRRRTRPDSTAASARRAATCRAACRLVVTLAACRHARTSSSISRQPPLIHLQIYNHATVIGTHTATAPAGLLSGS